MVEAHISRLRELAQALPRPGCEWEERPRFESPAGSDAIHALERAAGFLFPEDVKTFFAFNDSVVAMSVHNGYHIGGTELIASRLESGEIPRAVPDGSAAPIGFDSGGNAFLLSCAGQVWRWDHETGGMSLVADSFGTFLQRIVADWAAYIDDTAGWQFLV
jgi:hypothetical protein